VFQFLKEWNEVDARRKKRPDESSLDHYYRQLSVIKSHVWQSENEWRLMWGSRDENGSVYRIPITPECIRAVHLGLAISDDDKRKAITAAARHFPNAQSWCASKRHGDLCLDFHVIRPDRDNPIIRISTCAGVSPRRA
jgi:hypothetical protein